MLVPLGFGMVAPLSGWSSDDGISGMVPGRPLILGSFVCGAWWGQSWLQVAWTRSMGEWSIAQKELFSIVLAVMLWEMVWKGRAILVHCDNQAAVEVINSGFSGMMRLIRCLFFVFRHRITGSAYHKKKTKKPISISDKHSTIGRQ